MFKDFFWDVVVEGVGVLVLNLGVRVIQGSHFHDEKFGFSVAELRVSGFP